VGNAALADETGTSRQGDQTAMARNCELAYLRMHYSGCAKFLLGERKVIEVGFTLLTEEFAGNVPISH